MTTPCPCRTLVLVMSEHPTPAGAGPLIGVLTHELQGAGRDGPPRLNLSLSYTQAVAAAGGNGVVLPAHGSPRGVSALVRRLDGLLVSGGPDLDPATYGHARHPELGPGVDRDGDIYELAVLRVALATDLPVLAICRGMQALNVACGGTLHQHLPDRTSLPSC
jgi:gamma-glutamyl-gamma-aminobutyrate hydrolase PuuD